MKLVLSNKLPLLAFAAVAKTGEAADHRSGVHWARTTRSFNLGVIKSIDDQNNEWEDYFDLALSQWNLSDAFNLVSVSGNSNVGIRNSCPAEEGYIRVCNGNYGSTWWSGYAEYSYYYGQDGHEDHIFQCAVKLNDSKVAWGSEEKKILCHEIGHCLVRSVQQQIVIIFKCFGQTKLFVFLLYRGLITRVKTAVLMVSVWR